MHVELFWVPSCNCPIEVVDCLNGTWESFDHILSVELKIFGDISVSKGKSTLNSGARKDWFFFPFFWNMVFLWGFLFNVRNRECHDRI